MAKATKNVQPTIDAGLGLVYRLNLLWVRSDHRAIAGDLDGWNFVLDRIYCNLLYREKLKLSLDSEGKLQGLNIDEDAARIYDHLSRRIKEIKRRKMISARSKKKSDFDRYHELHYQTLMMKDIWLRKHMQQLGLYLRENAFDPSTALFGGGG